MKEYVNPQCFVNQRKNNMKLLAVIPALLAVSFAACKPAKKPLVDRFVTPEVRDNGEKIVFPDGAAGRERIKTGQFGSGKEFINIQAPAHVLANINTSVSGGRRVVFESAELNTVWAAYQRARNQHNRAAKNLNRIRDMYKLQVATEKDTIEAEADAGNSRAEMAEAEAKLRAVGFNPSDLHRVGGSVAWLVADVSESKLDSTRRGKKVKIVFNSFPDIDIKGTVEAIGDNVDPVTRTAKVRIAVPDAKHKYKPGMFAKVQFLDDAKPALVVPFSAIFSVEGESYVFIETAPNEFSKRKVVTGSSSVDQVEILEGIKKDERVVMEGTMLLKGLSIGY